MMESEVTGNCHASFGERDRETRKLQDLKVRSVPTLLSPLLANVALNGIESIHRYHKEGRKITPNTPSYKISEPSIRYADDMVVILRPEDNAEEILERIQQFLKERGLEVNQTKTKLTAATDGFDFLGWHFKVQSNGKFRSTPSVENYKAFRKKVKNIVNNSNYGAKTKAEKLAPIVRGWRNYHRFCKMDGSRFSLWFLNNRTFKVFNKEPKQNRESARRLIEKAFPAVPYAEGKHVMVRGDKSPYDGDIAYWSERNSKLYDNHTAKALKRQNHTCGYCGMKLLSEEKVHLHHVDANHNNWKTGNLLAVHESCHDYIHMSNQNIGSRMR